ncbi:hypothetical protein M404DRAFT_905126 [Pisolithus tinctorius Marx 270]|uniref:Uncharacterized protein n=1 Tax=Pisolithus tinctorius Marx 270 TaxID=870435 RepID=A0A0C3P9Z8_PISTI|nr:hypothetical protein M404DRAFT_905126 [Pisolithus tinctorius Marx 270]
MIHLPKVLDHVCGDLSSISLLLRVVPSAYVFRFTTRSEISETTTQPVATPPQTSIMNIFLRNISVLAIPPIVHMKPNFRSQNPNCPALCSTYS